MSEVRHLRSLLCQSGAALKPAEVLRISCVGGGSTNIDLLLKLSLSLNVLQFVLLYILYGFYGTAKKFISFGKKGRTISRAT